LEISRSGSAKSLRPFSRDLCLGLGAGERHRRNGGNADRPDRTPLRGPGHASGIFLRSSHAAEGFSVADFRMWDRRCEND
jgi:hypothetical protein